jgi:hypothetical protein
MGISGGRAPHGKRGWGSSKPGCRAQDAVQPVSANVMVKPPCAVSDVVPPCVGAHIATSAGARFRTFDAVDGPINLGTRACQCLGGVAPWLIYYLFFFTCVEHTPSTNFVILTFKNRVHLRSECSLPYGGPTSESTRDTTNQMTDARGVTRGRDRRK